MAAKKKAAVKRKAPARKKAAVKRNPAKRQNPEHIIVIDMPGNRIAYFAGYDKAYGKYQVAFDDDIKKAKRFDANGAKTIRAAVVASLSTPKMTPAEYKKLDSKVRVAKK